MCSNLGSVIVLLYSLLRNGIHCPAPIPCKVLRQILSEAIQFHKQSKFNNVCPAVDCRVDEDNSDTPACAQKEIQTERDSNRKRFKQKALDQKGHQMKKILSGRILSKNIFWSFRAVFC